MQRTSEETGWPHAIVAYADFSVDDVRPQLDRLKRYPLVRGVRMQLHWHENPLYRFAARADLCADPTIRRNVARLADYGWSFDLQVFAPQMPGAAGLAEACPKVTFVLQHAGMLEDLSPAGRAAWRAGMVRLAACPNVVCKLSGLGTFIHRNDPAHIAGIVAEALAIFGADRCLFGSNFPIEKLWTNYRALVDAYLDAVKSNAASSRRDHARHGDAGLSDRALSPARENKRRKYGRQVWLWKSRFSTMGTSSWNRASWCSAATAGARAGC